MAGFMDGYREGRNEVRAKRGAPPLVRKQDSDDPRREFDVPNGDAGDEAVWEGDSPARDSEVAEIRRLLADVTALAEGQKGEIEQQAIRVAELGAMIAPLVAVLLMPGVKTGLVNRFHPDKHPDADDTKRAAYNEALRVINEAYAIVDQIQASG
jgi:hypothetical protein